ncbi:MAG: CinA family protein [Alphaproteobacteria bacterium]
MAEGALKNSRAAIAVSITGIAVPGWSQRRNRLGLVWFGYAYAREFKNRAQTFSGDRRAIRAQSGPNSLTGP